MLEGGRTVYRLSSTSGSSRDIILTQSGKESTPTQSEVELMFDMLMDANAMILMVAGNMPDAGNQGHGAIYISLPDRMSLRMRAALNIVFPRTVVVFAGYPDQMEAFFARNPGLGSRVPIRITFKDYSADDMVAIAELEARRKGFSIQPRAREKLAVICEGAAGNAESGNGRFCRNLVESAIMGYALRVYGGDAVEGAPGFELTAEDFQSPTTRETNKKPSIGFN